MTVSDVAAFWSYSHEDDELDRGAIVELAKNLCNEFSLVTGGALTLFIDRAGISWGDEWRQRVDGALTNTTFFIPIVTPRYFARLECRRELLKFSSQAQSLGVSELLLPIRYAKVKDLTEQNPDEAIALVARKQYVDWTGLRLQGSSSPEYRTAVNALAIRLAEVADVITQKQLSEELREVRKPDSDELGLMDLFERINAALPEWKDSVDSSKVSLAQSEATFDVYIERIAKAKRSGSASSQFALMQRLAIDQIPIAEHGLKMAQIYAAKTLELDPLVLSAARIGASYPSEKEVFADLHSAIMTAYGNYLEDLSILDSPSRVNAAVWTAERAHVSRTMRKLTQILALHTRTVNETNQIIVNWVEQFRWLD